MRPAGRIAPQPWMTASETRAVVAALSAEGATVRFVGGCVRDAVLGRPVTDVDIASPDPPETVMRLLEAAGIRVVPTGIEHGTVTAVIPPRHFEITTLRRDVETFGRRARVAFTDDWTADAARRDFTINALFCDPDGTLYDPVGGLADLRAGRVRFVGDPETRIREDVLRLLRFFRFHAYYGHGAPDAEAMAACRRMAPALPKLSAERVASELIRLLAAPDPAPVLGLMIEVGALAYWLPEAGDLGGLAELCRLEGETPDAIRRLALIVRRGGGDGEVVGRRLRLSVARRKRLALAAAPPLALAPRFDAAAARRALYRLGREAFVDLVMLAWAEALAANPEREAALAAAYRPMLELARTWRPPVFPLGGDDVLALGVAPGPRVGALLAAVEDWWVAGDFTADRDTLRARLAALALAEAAS